MAAGWFRFLEGFDLPVLPFCAKKPSRDHGPGSASSLTEGQDRQVGQERQVRAFQEPKATGHQSFSRVTCPARPARPARVSLTGSIPTSYNTPSP